MLLSTANEATGSGLGASPFASADVEQNLRRLDRLANLGLFSAGIAHEIKNSLVSVNTMCQVMLENNQNGELADLVRRELQRIDEMVTQMLRMATPRPALQAPVLVHQLLDRSLRLLKQQLDDRGITVKREYGANPGEVRVDESQLQQVLINLLLNAVDAMPRGGELTARTECNGEYFRISISDTGLGIAPEHFKHLFEAFFTTKKHGTGLGLAISRRMIEEHRGAIEVQTEPGRGSTFCIKLPAD